MSTRVAVVTGVSRAGGIGAAIARELAADGWGLLLAGWPAYGAQESSASDSGGVANGSELVEELRGRDVAVAAIACDLAVPESAERIMSAAERLGIVSALVNNAAHSEEGGLSDLSSDLLDRHYAVNLRAPALLAREFVHRFQGETGRIVNLTSGQGLAPMPGELAYAATKGGLEALTVSLAPALAARGITVNAVDPGPTDSGWMNAEQRRLLVAPMGRLGEPRDAARLVRFLLSPEASWLTGQVIRSRGGA